MRLTRAQTQLQRNHHGSRTHTHIQREREICVSLTDTHPHPRRVGWMEGTSPGLAGLAQQIDLPWNAERHKIRGRLAGGKIRLKQGYSYACWELVRHCRHTHTLCAIAALPLLYRLGVQKPTEPKRVLCACVASFPFPAWLAVPVSHAAERKPIFNNSSAPAPRTGTMKLLFPS